MRILADASLPHLFLLFQEPFKLTLYNNQDDVPDLLPTHDILICRSTLTVSEKLLANSNIRCVATASSGIDHIDGAYLNKKKIALFDAKGSNAIAVADYVVATLACLHRSGHVIGKKAGVIGIGEVGSRVVARLKAAGFDVICFDPLRASLDKHLQFCSLSELSSCDLLSVHANLHSLPPHPSANLLSLDFLRSLKAKTTIINAARGGIVNEEALLNSTKPLTYCTDVYLKEPTINADIIDFATLCTPHIAGHSIESKIGAILKIRLQLYHHFGLSIPMINIPLAEKPPILSPSESWQEFILKCYDPLIDTTILKKAHDKTRSFLLQRRAHDYRHDFSFYNTEPLHPQAAKLMGF